MNPTKQEWLKLYDYIKISARNIKRKMPVDWDLSVEDIQGKLMDTVLHLIETYKAGGQSFVTYCYRLMEITTYRNLIQEYSRLKRNVQIVEDNDDDEIKHQIGIGYVTPLTVRDLGDRLEARDNVKTIMYKTDKIGRKICDMVMNGMNQGEIAKELGISQQAVAKRLIKMRKLIPYPIHRSPPFAF